MLTVTLRAHFDGESIRLDEPFDLPLDVPFLVTIQLPDSCNDSEPWIAAGRQSLSKAYGDDEPDYTPNDIKVLRAGTSAIATLLVGFDSAWTAKNSGGLVGVLRLEDGTFEELGEPQIANFSQAEAVIREWEDKNDPTATLVLLDQPTIVQNSTGQRPVENLVSSPVSLRYGGVQPANTGREEMFGSGAPVWPFLTRFGGAADPMGLAAASRVFETYPVLAMIALGWLLPDKRPTGRLPKYNPERETFLLSDWRGVCEHASGAFKERGLKGIVRWIDRASEIFSPSKCDQDRLDACLCLLVALHLTERKDCLMVGNLQTGYMVVPYGDKLHGELIDRCNKSGKVPSEWVQQFQAP